MSNIIERTLKLFNGIPIKTKHNKAQKNKFQEISTKTIPYGFIFSDEVIADYSEKELIGLIKKVKKEVGITSKQLNNSFHKCFRR